MAAQRLHEAVNIEQTKLVLADVMINGSRYCTDISYHQFYFSWLATTALRNLYWNDQLTQVSLIEMMKHVIHLNNHIGIDSGVSIWDEFFRIYYKLPQQFSASYVCKLLTKCMPISGINVKPNFRTFSIVLHGIAGNMMKLSQSEFDVFVYIKNAIMRDEYEIYIEDYNLIQLQFNLYSNNLKYYGAKYLIRLLIDHSNVVFKYADIIIFNAILSEIEIHFPVIQDLLLALDLIMNKIMKKHRISYNHETFGILRSLKEKYPGITCLRIYQSMSYNYQSDHVWTIIDRIDHIKHIMNSTAYQNSLKAMDGGAVAVPDPCKKYRKRQWFATINRWKRWLESYSD